MTLTDTAHPETVQFTVRRTTSDHAGSLQLPLPPAGHFINGSFVPGSTGELIDVVDPTTEQVIASVQAGTADDVDAAVQAAVVAQKTWGATTPKERADVLNLIANIIEENRQAFELIESANTGKPQAVAEDDVTSTIDTFRFMAGASRTLTSMAGGDYATDHTSVILREPVGVVGVITPWNYPLLMAAWKVAPILAAGNSIVLKPSEQTPLSTLKLAELLAGRIPDGILNVVTGQGRTVGQRLSEHPDIALVALTGSVVSGQAVAETAAKSVKRVHLELGGNSAMVVLEDADLDAVISTAAWGSFFHQGQICMTTGRHLVADAIYNDFVEALADKAAHLPVGNPATEEVALGPVIDEGQRDKIHGLVTATTDAGAKAAAGASYDGLFYRPTVLSEVTREHPAFTEEIFGPVAPVTRVGSEDEAVELARASEYGLSLGIITSDVMRGLALADRIPTGIVHINDQTVNDEAVAPFGGIAASGTGARFGGEANVEAFTDVRWTTVRADVATYPF